MGRCRRPSRQPARWRGLDHLGLHILSTPSVGLRTLCRSLLTVAFPPMPDGVLNMLIETDAYASTPIPCVTLHAVLLAAPTKAPGLRTDRRSFSARRSPPMPERIRPTSTTSDAHTRRYSRPSLPGFARRTPRIFGLCMPKRSFYSLQSPLTPAVVEGADGVRRASSCAAWRCT